MVFCSHPISVLVASVACALAQHLDLHVNATIGDFIILHNGVPWLSGGEYRVGNYSSSNSDLVIVQRLYGNGADKFGSFNSQTLTWAQSSARSTILMQTTFRTYKQDKGLIVFEQFFPSELALGSPASQLSASTIFPGFTRPQGDLPGSGSSAKSADLPCFSYHGIFPAMKVCTLGTYRETPQGGAPLVIYDDANSSLPMTVFSPLNYPKAHHMAGSKSFIGAGVKASVQTIPAGWRQLFILSAGKGINAGMMAWGDRMLRFTGKARVNNMYRDDVHGSIGYWTDNGGYYHYSIGNNKSLGDNYEEVLPKVKQYHDSIGVPFKHWQLDSWFYPKDGGVNPGGGGGAVTNWTALPSVFPHGMAHFQSEIGLPMVMHNRQWSSQSDYIHNLTFQWYTSKKAAVPKDPPAFFDWFFQQQKGWGLAMYEQDWMCTEYGEVAALQTNISMGDLWLYGMASGAEKSGRTVQYCMPYPYDLLSAAAYPAVTNARATGDYFHAENQWAVGNTAMFYWALGILPFKDGFYSSSLKQTGGQTEGPETDPDREALMATLSGAMVGPMDGIYLLNKTRVMTTCRADGTVLKPDRPISVVDSCFRRREPTCFEYETHSDIQGYGRVHYYFNNANGAHLTPEDIYLNDEVKDHIVYNWYTGELLPMHDSVNVSAGYEGHVYAVVVPIVEGWAFVGEVEKFVTASKIRFSKITIDRHRLAASVSGVKGETVRICAMAESSLHMDCTTVSFESSAIKDVEFNRLDSLVI